MPFIGKQPQTGAYSKLDSITTSATATYNLTLDGGAYYPQSANHLLVSLNGVMQAPQDSFTVSGSQITFASALTSSDNIDFIMALGDTLDIGVPSAGSVNTSQLADGGVTNTKLANDSITINGTTIALGGSDTITAGKVLQVATATLSVTQSFTGGGYTDVNSLTVTMTPRDANSKFLIMGYFGAISTWHASRERTLDGRVLRNGNTITGNPSTDSNRVGTTFRTGSSEGDGNHPRGVHFTVMDEPSSTSALTYKVQVRPEDSSSGVVYINRSASYSDVAGSYGTRPMSTLTVMEIAG